MTAHRAERARLCIVYDCLYPWTIGGAERWLTGLARFAADSGYEVTYLTRLQWSPHDAPEIPGVRVVPVSPNDDLYRADGSRTLREPLRFGRGVLRHLRAKAGTYDLVHTHAFPFFGALAVRRALRGTDIPIVVDWAEVWPKQYWIDYAGRAAGTVGSLLQQRTANIQQHALIPSVLHRDRLLDLGVCGDVTLLTGQYDGEIEPAPRPSSTPPTVVFAGRHIPEKNVLAVPPAIAEARRAIPDLRCVILGEGPDTPALRRSIEDLALGDAIEARGFVAADDVDAAIGSAACLLLPSVREGYGLVVVEAAARGTPSIVVDASDNAAVALIEQGVNGFVASSTSPSALAQAIVSAVNAGAELRRSTSAWANARGEALTIQGSMSQVLAVYERALGGPTRSNP